MGDVQLRWLVRGEHWLVGDLPLYVMSYSNEDRFTGVFVSLVDTGRPYVYLPCYTNSSWGNEPYFSNCLKPSTSTTTATTIITSARTVDSPPSIVSLEEIARVCPRCWSIVGIECVRGYFSASHQYFGSDRYCRGLFKWRAVAFEFVTSFRIHGGHPPSY